MTKIFRNVIGNTLRGDEDEHFRVLVADDIEVLEELAALLEVGTDLDVLGDVVIGGELHGTDVHLDEVVQEILEREDQLQPTRRVIDQRTEASFWTSLGQVALNMTV